ncbi:uncharacterized protein PRCAT00003816001 [Priceomyces carsonii]|uniref:uncharacterized protein n=1 Tax=Priceomyces carsonii TaxID=28549 RepID=UPI002EDAA4B0|nr:unnamed protein product [Priceomyces carsonii]
MPTVNLDYSRAHKILNSDEPDNFVSTPYGLSLLEIQGDLNLPTNSLEDDPGTVKIDDIREAVKFGKLEIDEKDSSRITLYIGKSQRLLGSIVDLDTPLAVMKVPTDESVDIEIVDVIKKKMIFKQRPLPIMTKSN